MARRLLLTALFMLAAFLLPQPAHAQVFEEPVPLPPVRSYCFANWVWNTGQDHPGPAWSAPYRDRVIGGVDLRSLPQQGRAGGRPQGYGFFVYDGDVTALPGLYCIGIGLDFYVDTPDRQALKTLLSLDADIEGITTRSIIWELLIQHADPTGQRAWKPLRGTFTNGIRLTLAGEVVRQEAFDAEHPAWPGTLAVFQEGYRKLRIRDVAKGSQNYLDVLGAAARKYGVAWQTLVPSDLPLEAPKPPSTTYTEGFTTNGDTFGGDTQSWTEVTQDWDNVSSEGQLISNAFGDARMEADLDSDDHYVAVDVIQLGTNSWVGPAARFDNAARTYYTTFPYSANNNMYLRKVVAGVETDLPSSPVGITISLTEEYRVECDSSDNITGYQAGVSRMSDVDTSITLEYRPGVAGYKEGGTTRFDDLEASDLAGEAAQVFWGYVY